MASSTPATRRAGKRPRRSKEPAAARVFVSFWGRTWQAGASARKRAAAALDALDGQVVQASYYVDEGWYDGMRPNALRLDFIQRTIQLLIDRGVIGDVEEGDDPGRAPLLVFLDDSLALAGVEGAPSSSFHAHFKTMLGGQCAYGVVPVDAPREDAVRLLIAIKDNPAPINIWANCDQTLEAISDPPSYGVCARLPDVVVAERVARFRMKADEVGRFVTDLGWPPSLAQVTALRQAANYIEKAVVRRATRPTPATESELTDWRGPNPRITFAERLISLRNYLRRPNHPDALLVSEVIDSIDEAPFKAMRRAYFNDGAFGFVDAVFWIYYKLLLARSLGLDTSPPRTILDIGCGGGHLSRICQHFGHEVIGTDIEHPVYLEIAAALGATRIISKLEPFKAMPQFGRKFDMVVASQIEFDRAYPANGGPVYWSIENWIFLFNDLIENQLRFPARIHLALNFEDHQGRGVFNQALLGYCMQHGAAVNEKRGIVDWVLAHPVKLD